MTIKVGVAFDGFVPFAQSVALAGQAVEAGAASLWMAEHLGYREAVASCMAFALKTREALLVPTAVSPYLWHPTPTAMALATLAEAAPGRVALAVGIGNPMFLKESGQEVEQPLKAVREFVECLQALWGGEPVYYQGAFCRLEGAKMAFTPPGGVAIYIAATKERMLRLTGRIADGVALTAGLTTAFVRQSLAEVARGAGEAGREPASLRRAGYLLFAASRDGREARELVRAKLAFLLRNRFLEDNLRDSGVAIDQPAIMEAVARRDLERAAGLVSDEAVDAFAIGGTPRECRARLEEYIAAGIEEPVLVVIGGEAQAAHALSLIREISGR
jgi:5,10-methylenetetrahydromethanopterin reductase